VVGAEATGNARRGVGPPAGEVGVSRIGDGWRAWARALGRLAGPVRPLAGHVRRLAGPVRPLAGHVRRLASQVPELRGPARRVVGATPRWVPLVLLPLVLATTTVELPAVSRSQALAAAPRHHVRRIINDPAPDQRPDAILTKAEPAPPLPPATAAPQPAPPSVVGGAALRPHEVFAFAPYWTLPQEASFDYGALSTVSYFGVDVAADGSIVPGGAGWDGYQSQALVDLVDRAHAAGDRVVLTAKCFDQPSLDRLTSSPAAAAHLADQLIAAIRAKNMDGANIDFEGNGPADRVGLVALMATLSVRLRAADPHWQLTMDTYGGSATDPGGFFDIPALAPSVNAFFVMAYDMYRPKVASPNAALQGQDPSDADVVSGYLSAVPASKVILGIPFYGYEWKTATNAPEAPTQSGPIPLSYGQLASASSPVYWDRVADVPWTEFRDPSGQWYEAYFDDPPSVALKAQLANSAHLAGVGIWALGMDGGAPAMMAAVLGHAAPLKDYRSGPGSLSSTPKKKKKKAASAATSTSTSSTSTSTSSPSSTSTSTTTTTLPGGRKAPGGGTPPVTVPGLFGGGSTTTTTTTQPPPSSTTTTTRPSSPPRSSTTTTSTTQPGLRLP
jgi:hypothetical protein